MTDPNGWVQNPPSVFVKVHGTSREMINGKLGLVLQYAADRGRYTVLLCESQDPVSLKSDNLVPCGMLEKAQAYMQMMQHNPDIQRQLQQISQQVQQRTGLTPQYALALVAMALLAGWYTLGVTKLLLVLTVLTVVLTVIGPDLAAGGTARTILRAAPARWRQVVREQIPVVGAKIADRTILLNVFTALLVAFVAYSLVASSSSSPAGRAAKGASAPITSTTTRMLSVDMQKHYYKLGFDDATNAKEFGASLVVSAATADESATGAVDNDDYAWRNLDSSYETTTPKKKTSPLSLQTAFAAYTIYRTLQPLAVNADGRFDVALLRVNLTHLEVWKLGILGFAVYRIVSVFL
jgi:hypothetical protein